MQPPPRTVLIVDDSPEDRELYRRYLQRDPDYSYTLLEASLGWQGLELWQQQRPDLVLLDYRLPDLDGLEFLAQLPSPTPHPCLPVIVMTGQGNEAIAVQAMKAGAQDYLVKGQITPEGLHLAIHGAIETVKLRTELQQRIERERVVGQITRQIHQSLDLDRILQTTVTEVRQFLNTDRVLVFQLQPDGNGTVVAESVGDGWRSLLSSTIYDPCLAEEYLKYSRSSITYDSDFTENCVERYRQGQVTAIPNIHSSDFFPCHVELLAQFQVNANLVVPILHDDQFWGLLIAHHCAASRYWQPLEIDLLKELATQMGIALRQAELYQQSQAELAERNRVEAELRESEERFRTSVENMLDCFAIYQAIRNEQGEIVDFRTEYVNDAACLNNQMTREQQIGRGLCELLPGHRESGLFDEYCQVVETGQPLVKDSLVYADDYGQQRLIRAFDIRVAKFRDGFVATWRDITERKQIEEALRESEQQLRIAKDAAALGIHDYDITSGTIQWDARVRELWGVEPDEPITYEVFFSRVHPEDRAATEAAMNRSLDPTGDGKYDAEYRVIHRTDGITCWIAATGIVFFEHDRAVRLVGTMQDITARKLAEQETQAGKQILDALMEYVPEGITIADAPDVTIRRVSRYGQQLTGRSPDVLEGISVEEHVEKWELFYPDGITPASNEELPLTRAVQQGEVVTDEEWVLQRPDGTKITILCNAGPIYVNGEITGGVIAWRDISDRVQFERDRERILQHEQAARAEAERVNRIKDEFLAVLSHELRSPLNPILGWAKLLQTRTFDAAATADALATIERNARLQTQLIDDLLDVAKILRGKLSLEMVTIDLVFVIEGAIDTVRNAAIAKNIHLHPVLPQIGRISGDATRLQQIVWNLLSNAIKFTPNRGRVEVRLECVEEQAQITVSDTGKGIKPDFLPYIFESFRQEDATTTRQYGGLGLGLAIVRHLVEAHGGTIRANSPGEGQGATFTVRFPLLESELGDNQSEELLEQELDLTGVRVLAVDDEPDARELLSVLLSQYGAEVLMVNSATEVLEHLESFQPHVLVSDIGMPQMDGFALIQQIRALPPEKGGQIPAIALTAYARGEDYREAIASGYQRHLTKPLDLNQLVKAVVELTRHTTSE